ncbi:hypothetical protein O9G_003329 [Rozella allomycis CSF55]|nr:hypothetical protein O9G_003329 [Rozella allomycis CSF55]|eukprot:EPZ36458.1 hypothetical protein O9G_003329 [Rozella allomycis CSF55]
MTAWDGLEAAKAAVDQDRVAIDYFAKGGEEGVKANKVDILLDKEQTGATIVIRNEDHTLGNLLRHMIAQK